MSNSLESRHGKRAPGIVVATFGIPKSLKSDIKRIAFREGCTPSEWMRMKLRESVRRHYAALKNSPSTQ